MQVGDYFHDKLLFWRPRLLFNVNLICELCKDQLGGHGVYGGIRRVVDVKGYYYLACEYLGKHELPVLTVTF